MTEAVMADAQFGTATVLKPFENFEDVYQGKDSNIPIAFPGNLDPNAGKPGFDPNLIKGHPVPFGSKVTLWIPTILDEPIAANPKPYGYRVIWRLRNLRDFREDRAPYHFPRQSLGEDDKFVIPAAKRTILFEGAKQIEGATNSTINQTMTSFEELQFPTNVPEGALTPSGDTAVLQQGLGISTSKPGNATFNSVQLDAEGDEMIILVTARGLDGAVREWDFEEGVPNGEDNEFSKFYGKGNGKIFRDLGIYVFTGTNP